jgi:hypothetical protein
MNLPAAALLAVLLATTGCRGCHDGHPYVPYAVGSAPPIPSLPVGGPPAATTSVTPEAGRWAFADDPAVLAPPGLTEWPIDGVVLQAPEGRVFVAALVRDFDGDGAKDAFAIARGGDGGDPDELLYYRGRANAEVLEEPKAFAAQGISRDSTCGPVNRLAAVGGRSVLVELGTQCSVHASSTPNRWVAVVSAGREPSVRLAVTVADPPGAATLSVDGETADRDGDGLDDVALRVAIEGGGLPAEAVSRVTAIFAWLDRPAGLSRDVAATEGSFAALAATATAHAARAKEASAVPAFAAQVRALWRAACADGGSPRVTGVAGRGPIACGVGRALESVGLAEVRAYAATGDSLRAALALDRAERLVAPRTASRASEALRWIAQIAPVATALALRSVAAVPVVGAGHEPAWGSLAFEPSGRLLVRTRAGVVRVDPDAGDEAAADGIADWKSAVTSPDGSVRWIESYDPCDGLPLRATFAQSGGDDLRDVALHVAPSLGDRCVGSRGALARTVPIAWGPAGIEAIVEGEPVLVSSDLTHASPLGALLGQPTTPGAPRSPDGSMLVIATSAGLLVHGPAGARLLRAPELDGTYGDQHDCVVSNGATHVACVRGGKAWVGTWASL